MAVKLISGVLILCVVNGVTSASIKQKKLDTVLQGRNNFPVMPECDNELYEQVGSKQVLGLIA